MKKIVCVFPKGENVHLTKDVGLIPYFLFKQGYFESTIAFYSDPKDLPYLDTEVHGLKYARIKKIFRSNYANILFFLLCQIRQFDIIMMFHPNYFSLSIAYFIKKLSFNRIKFYFKMDLDSTFDFSGLYKRSWKRKLFNYLMGEIDLLSVESYDDFKQFQEFGKFSVKHIPNGLIPSASDHFQKENVLLTVGRLGSYQKDTETLLKAFKAANPKNLKLLLIGQLENGFQSSIDEYFKANPWLIDKVVFKGQVNDREELMNCYRRCKFFILTSRHEGFPLVLLEAVSHGCFIISSDFPAARDITDNERYGRLFKAEDDETLAKLILSFDRNDFSLPAAQEMSIYANEKYNWRRIVYDIYLNLK
ncbi:glycosyltransferase [Sphingobacterium athyrii]|uniref:Glycosyl transferase family 1 domain-containing protein n=1 Tax=Sphingobacterium athyrii TaxID=2152717 RepID=A0A363NQF6_9SPHI|nr:glycosyltransferase [Sphingobacterium athyrii]PUV22967.1 hypothetical protein DCO56_18785 [Sphingobacterium athyrii]